MLNLTSSIVSETLSEAIKILKGEYTIRAIKEHKMDKAIIFCRTKVDCDNMETYFNQCGGGKLILHSLYGENK
jgi:ATP-dependent RNA helicase DDX1